MPWRDFDETGREDEMVKPDAFANPYVGKQYGSGHTEVLSMGLEMMYTDPVGFARKDPEHFALIQRYLRGELRG